jgi:hypothetical protein
MAVVTRNPSPGEPELPGDRDPADANAAVGPGGYRSPARIAPKVRAFREDDIRSLGISERGS